MKLGSGKSWIKYGNDKKVPVKKFSFYIADQKYLVDIFSCMERRQWIILYSDIFKFDQWRN